MAESDWLLFGGVAAVVLAIIVLLAVGKIFAIAATLKEILEELQKHSPAAKEAAAGK